ncbi:MAG: recombination protein RecR [Erysipelotrichaceae bacterium]|nr:recombination protein RecR [Erysipelotrichaceae bacterium]
MIPASLEKLVESFRLLPGVGAKSAERYALSMLDASLEDVEEFAKALLDVKTKIKTCPVCGNLTEEDKCSICSDSSRDHHTICVVQSMKDIIAMEKTNEYKGVYHVLQGLISTTKGILPEDLNIKSLLERLNDETKEIILATNATMEGETTALYLDKILSGKGVLVTRIAYGLPMGGHLDYADELTLIKAIEGRKKI